MNLDGLGNLSGYAWGANIGWITFEQTYGKPKINLLTGQFERLHLERQLRLDFLEQRRGLCADGHHLARRARFRRPALCLAAANFGTTNVDANADPTGKGMTIGQDYLAGTDPNNVNSILQITAESFSSGGTSASITWNSVLTRYYYIQKTPSLSSPVWTDSGLGLISPSVGSTTTAGFADSTAPVRFYRVQAVRPLTP